MTRALVFDSGVGGLTIAAELRKAAPDWIVDYAADSGFDLDWWTLPTDFDAGGGQLVGLAQRQVEQYPQASIELELYTLSSSKEFIRG